MVLSTTKILPRGKIALPTNIRKNMGLSTGDKITLIYENNRIIMVNPAIYAMETLQNEMEGKAEKAGLTSEEDVINLCRDVRVEVEDL